MTPGPDCKHSACRFDDGLDQWLCLLCGQPNEISDAPDDEDEPDCGHHSWAGLMSLLDEHWPDDIFPTRYEDDPKRGAGPRIVSLMRWVDQLQAKVARVETLATILADGPGQAPLAADFVRRALAGDA